MVHIRSKLARILISSEVQLKKNFDANTQSHTPVTVASGNAQKGAINVNASLLVEWATYRMPSKYARTDPIRSSIPIFLLM